MAVSNAFGGEYESGKKVRDNISQACKTVGDVLKSALGPKGLDKMIVDNLGEVTITNDGATILKRLEMSHPVGKMLAELANLQDAEAGDGTTSVVILAAELVTKANDLMTKQHFHAATVIAGYKLAVKECIAFISKNLQLDVSALDENIPFQVAKTTLSSKLISTSADHFANLCLAAINAVKTVTPAGKVKYPVSSISINKTHGKSAAESELLMGYALDRVGRAAQGMPMLVENAKIALIDFPLKQHRTQMGVTIEIHDAQELEAVRERERDICKEKIDAIVASGANVVFSTGGLDDLAMKYLVAHGIFGVRRVAKRDMRRLCDATGGRCVISMTTMDCDGEVFPIDALGTAGSVEEVRTGDWDSVVVRDCPSKAVTLIVRGANDFVIDETERSIHDVLCILSRTLESKSVVAGGGAVEVALNCHLENFATSIGSREQSAVRVFAECLLSIPRQLCVNAAVESSQLVPVLRAHHAQGQERRRASNDIADYASRFFGLDLEGKGTVSDNLESGVLEAALAKKKQIKYACDTAVAILRIDDMLRLQVDQDTQGQR